MAGLAIANAGLAISNILVGIGGIIQSEVQKAEVNIKIDHLKDLYAIFKPLATTLSNDDISNQKNAMTTILANTNNLKIARSLADAKYLSNKTTVNILTVKGIDEPGKQQERTNEEQLKLIETEVNPVVESLTVELITYGSKIVKILRSGVKAAIFILKARDLYTLNKPSAKEDIPELEPLLGDEPSPDELAVNAKEIEPVSKLSRAFKWGVFVIQAMALFVDIYNMIKSAKQFNEAMDNLNTRISDTNTNITKTRTQIIVADNDKKDIDADFKKLDKSVFGIQASIKSLDQFKLEAEELQAKGGTYYDSNKKVIDDFENITYGDYFNMTHDTVVGNKDNFISGQMILFDFFRINKTSLTVLSDWAAIMRQIQILVKKKLSADFIFQVSLAHDPNLTREEFDVLKKYIDERKFE